MFLPYTSSSIDYGLDYPYSPSLGDMDLCQIAWSLLLLHRLPVPIVYNIAYHLVVGLVDPNLKNPLL